MTKAILTVGVPGSGKSTYAENKCKKDRNWINVNRDDIRFSITGTCGWAEYKFNSSIENMVTKIQEAIVQAAYAVGKNVIISDTNLNPKIRKALTQWLTKLGYHVEERSFPIDIQTAIKRDAQRANGVGYDVIHKQWKQWLDYIDFKRYVPNENLPSAVIFDVDGTLADMGDIRGPFDWDKVDQDRPRQIVCEMMWGLSAQQNRIVVLSGRDGCCEQKTKEWLDRYCPHYDELFMRAPGDRRKDSIIKEEIFWERIAPRYHIEAVVDDRPKVCRMWRDLGLKVIQVADPYLEF